MPLRKVMVAWVGFAVSVSPQMPPPSLAPPWLPSNVRVSPCVEVSMPPRIVP